MRVELDGELLAESRRPLLLLETTRPPRYYLPGEDVLAELRPTETARRRRRAAGAAGHALVVTR